MIVDHARNMNFIWDRILPDETRRLLTVNAKIKELALVKYDDATYEHAVKVAEYSSEMLRTLGMALEIQDEIIIEIVGISHDLVEDTDVTLEDLRNILSEINNTVIEDYIISCIELVSINIDYEDNQPVKSKVVKPYNTYIEMIKDNKPQYPAAWFVKLADIKHHFELYDTLTDSLKDKYVKALAILL